MLLGAGRALEVNASRATDTSDHRRSLGVALRCRCRGCSGGPQCRLGSRPVWHPAGLLRSQRPDGGRSGNHAEGLRQLPRARPGHGPARWFPGGADRGADDRDRLASLAGAARHVPQQPRRLCDLPAGRRASLSWSHRSDGHRCWHGVLLRARLRDLSGGPRRQLHDGPAPTPLTSGAGPSWSECVACSSSCCPRTSRRR